MASDGQHCSFVLLAEFDIDRGAQLTYQFPQPLGTDETLLANLMLPDGAEKQSEDWTIFFLNQTPFNTIAPVLALETPELNGRPPSTVSWNGENGRPQLLYVLNLVRTKIDKTVRRGAVVKAMAICTRHPFIQIFKPILLMALDDYYTSPSQECLARLFDAVNAMDLSGAPTLTRSEKIVMRTSDWKDIFAEKFQSTTATKPGSDKDTASTLNGSTPSLLGAKDISARSHRSTPSWDSRSSFEDGIIMREKSQSRDRAGTTTSSSSTSTQQQQQGGQQSRHSPDNSFDADESVVFIGNEPGMDTPGVQRVAPPIKTRARRGTDASSTSSHGTHGRRDYSNAGHVPSGPAGVGTGVKDTHFYQTAIAYEGHQIPIKMPLYTFPEEVGDYSLIQLIQTFSPSPSTSQVQGPHHPHLHTNGPSTNPIVILFNALVTGKRIIFLGHNRPAGQVATYVLAACALGSGCGCVLRGFIERAFPYANLTNKDEWESIPAYIAGVTNPIFESSGTWDLLCDVGSGRVVVHKDIHLNYPPNQYQPTSGFGLNSPPLIVRSGTLKAEGSAGNEEEMLKGAARDGGGERKGDFLKDGTDNLFVEDIISAINYHFGENLVRARFAEYASRFVRLAARYEEECYGSTEIGYRSSFFSMSGLNTGPQLGSGMAFLDDAGGARELAANASRIEAWRRTKVYQYYEQDFKKAMITNALQRFDLTHQLWRLRHGRNMPDPEVELILRTIADNIRTYESAVEASISHYLLSYIPPYTGGLAPLSFALFHPQESVRRLAVEIFNELRQYPVGVQFLQALNSFQRYAYVRQAHALETRNVQEHQHHQAHSQLQPPPTSNLGARNTNRSESSLVG
ncbi:mesa protein [Punctularia strigosozonata HHB-11173 SS5]|uniref:mesa protein n=1 Tax=Punctularia strigosozonata (strain HHB-11173) TaxID=741275 RepID=UPI0004416467|nr:mesa protein [Punctularia strigosozonata HHB-11173 SS5]EIN08406.1 mesa protein [Punctularia strigosozonata HHB-11173 SS5]